MLHWLTAGKRIKTKIEAFCRSSKKKIHENKDIELNFISASTGTLNFDSLEKCGLTDISKTQIEPTRQKHSIVNDGCYCFYCQCFY